MFSLLYKSLNNKLLKYTKIESNAYCTKHINIPLVNRSYKLPSYFVNILFDKLAIDINLDIEILF
jgi:hypothetical protein